MLPAEKMVGCVKATTDRVGREGSITASGFDMKEKIGGGSVEAPAPGKMADNVGVVRIHTFHTLKRK